MVINGVKEQVYSTVYGAKELIMELDWWGLVVDWWGWVVDWWGWVVGWGGWVVGWGGLVALGDC